MALVQLVGKIATAISNSDYVLIVFLDSSKPFDQVNHRIVPTKL